MNYLERQIIERYLEGYSIGRIAVLMAMTRRQVETILAVHIDAIIEAERIERRKMEAIKKTPNLDYRNDPRSRVCQLISSCGHYRCHLAPRCPAYQNFLQKRRRIYENDSQH